MKKLSILLLAVVALLFVGMYNAPTAQANLGQNTDLNVTVVEGKGLVNRTNQKLNVPHGFGSKVSVDISGLVNSEKGFAYYILNGEKIDTESVNLTLSGSTNLVIVMAGAGEKAVSYVDTNGELLDVDYVTETEPVFTGVNPVKPGFNFTGFSGSYEDNHAVYTAQYSRVNQTVINVSVTGGTKDLAEVKYNDVVTLTPDAGNFSYWADMDGQVISRNPNYAFSALNDVQIQAVFDGAVNTDPVIYLSNVTGITPNAKSFLGYIEGDFVEYGVLASNKEEVLTLDTLGVTVIPSQALNPETNEFLRSIPETEDLKSFRAYAKLADGSVVYSENNFVSYTSEILSYQTGFESEEGFSTTTIYNNATPSIKGPNGKQWATVFGTPTTTSPINGDQSVQIRYYGSTLGYLSSEFAFDNVSKMTFSSKGVTGNKFAVSYSYNKSGEFILIDQFDATSSSSEFEVVFPQNLTQAVYIRFQLTQGSGRADLSFDDIKVYANESVNSQKYSINLMSEGNLYTIQNVYRGERIERLTVPTKVGHSFIGWFDETDNLVDGTTQITRHMTLNAKFEVEKYTLTFDSNGGTPVTPIIGDYASEIVAPAAPTKDGYTFTGWSPVLPETMPAGNQTYTATWTAIDYTITFNVDGGSDVEALTQAYGSELVLPVPTKDGFNFVGWFADVDRTIPFEVTTMPLGNTTLYALWQDASLTSIVTFEVNGGSEIAPVVVNNGGTVSEPIPPTKSGHTFAGWFADSGLTITYDFNNQVTTDITLYAKWNAELKVIKSSDFGETNNTSNYDGAIRTIDIENGVTDPNPTGKSSWKARGENFNNTGWAFVRIGGKTQGTKEGAEKQLQTNFHFTTNVRKIDIEIVGLDSASGTEVMWLQTSSDGTNWVDIDSINISLGINTFENLNIDSANYIRFVFVRSVTGSNAGTDVKIINFFGYPQA